MKQNLQTVKNYAIRKGVTVQAIYSQIKNKKVESVNIDGVIFIKI